MNKLKKVLIAMILALLLLSGSSLHMGKGEIYKTVFWEGETPIDHAKVGLDTDGDGTVDAVTYTSSVGIAYFLSLPYGTYYIYVDIDNDGIWETTAEEVIVDGTEYVHNVYSPPEMWRLEEGIRGFNGVVDQSVQ